MMKVVNFTQFLSFVRLRRIVTLQSIYMSRPEIVASSRYGPLKVAPSGVVAAQGRLEHATDEGSFSCLFCDEK